MQKNVNGAEAEKKYKGGEEVMETKEEVPFLQFKRRGGSNERLGGISLFNEGLGKEVQRFPMVFWWRKEGRPVTRAPLGVLGQGNLSGGTCHRKGTRK